jgi:hypothetical protein
MSLKYLFFAAFIVVVIFFLKDFIKNYRSYKKKLEEKRKKINDMSE